MHAAIIYLLLISLSAAIIYKSYSKPLAMLIILFTYSIFILRVFLPTADNFMHTKLFKIPEKIKCFVTINCKRRSCEAQNEMESQYNGDFDLLSVGHIFFWALATILEPKITFMFVFVVSSMWEIFEAGMGCAGFAIHARITDVLINIIGFALGKFARNLLLN